MDDSNYEQLIGKWHRDRNLIDGSTDKDQYMKLIQEAGELSDSLCKGKDIRDDIGDIMVVLINIMVRNNLTIEECLSVAYADIKDRIPHRFENILVDECTIVDDTTCDFSLTIQSKDILARELYQPYKLLILNPQIKH